MPPKYLQTVEKIFAPALDEDLIPVWDINEGKGKSFRISKIEVFSTEKSPKKKDTKKNSPENKYREKALSSWERQQEQVNKAREIINKIREEAIQRKSQ